MWKLPGLRRGALAVWRRNILVWRKLMAPAMVMNFGEPLIYLLGLGYGLGFFIRQMSDMPYLSFLASGIIASSAMTTAAFEGMYSVFTRMVPQQTYDAILATPLEVDDILAGEMLWCGTKSVISGVAILIVAAALGVVDSWYALWVIPVVFLVGMSIAGPAMIMSALAPNYDFFNYFFVLIITPMFMLCGVFFPIDTLPIAVQSAVQVLPLTVPSNLLESAQTWPNLSKVEFLLRHGVVSPNDVAIEPALSAPQAFSVSVELTATFSKLMAAFRSRSISVPHSHSIFRLFNGMSWIVPQPLHILLDGKKRSAITTFDPYQFALYSSCRRNSPKD